MNSKEEIFEQWYVERGFPELPNADFASIKAAFIQGWAFGRAEAKAELPKEAPRTPQTPLPERSRYRIGKVSPDDQRPVTEAQMKFVRKLIGSRIITVWATDYVFNINKLHCDTLGSIIPGLLEGKTHSIRMLTMGQASQIIDLLKKRS